jgi:hypothetical protein
MVRGAGLRFWSLRVFVSGLWLAVQRSGFMVHGLEFRIQIREECL